MIGYRKNAKSPTRMDRIIGERLLEARRLKQWTQEALADELDIVPQQIQKYEIGKNRIPASRLHAVSSLLGMPIEWFFAQADQR